MSAGNNGHVLYVEELGVQYTLGNRLITAVDDVTFGLRRGESYGIVGESGCGKSTLALAITHLLPPNSRITSGRIYFEGRVIADTESGASFSLRKMRKGAEEEKKLSTVRWSGISMIFQGALDSLNPLFRIGEQVDDIFIYKKGLDEKEARTRTVELLKSVGLESWVVDVFPHQLSGGMKQRVIIAMAISLNPLLVIADEPTTSLDVITQYRIIEEIKKLQRKHEIALINISHDISLISNLSERIMVMYAGRMVEKLPTGSFDGAQHPYTKLLVESIPKIDRRLHYIRPIKGYPPSLEQIFQGCPFLERCDFGRDVCKTEEATKSVKISEGHYVSCPVRPFSQMQETYTAAKENETDPYADSKSVSKDAETVLEARGLTQRYLKRTGIRESHKGKNASVIAVDNIDVSLRAGESLAIVGETGSGKSTLSRILSMLETATEGEVRVLGKPVDASDRKTVIPLRTSVQVVFQDPYQSLNPRHSVFEIVSEPLVVNRITRNRSEMMTMVRDSLLKSGLTPPEDYMTKYPHQLSGGQRQRVSIARALVLHPRVLITDEPISMLDVSLRAGILNLLRRLKAEDGVSIVYITHDIGSARYVSDRVAVMYRGKIVEEGYTEDIIARPSHPYTMALLVSSMGIRGNLYQVLGERIFEQVESGRDSGCIFADRCPLVAERCFEEHPQFEQVENGHRCLCHFGNQLFSHVSEVRAGTEATLESRMKNLISEHEGSLEH